LKPDDLKFIPRQQLAPPMRKVSNPLIPLVVVVSIVIADQLTKLIFVNKQLLNASCNQGIGFGIESTKIGSILFSSVALVTVASVLIYLTVRKLKRELIFPLTLVTAGAFSNLLDRFIRGCVADFINLKIWPSFNLADAIITIGLVWVVIILFSSPDS